MIGIVVAAHGSLAELLMESTQMIIGDMEQVATVSLMPGDSLEGLVDRMRTAVNSVNQGDGVIIFLDLFGGTPSNAAALLTQQLEGVHAITGVNFPMLAEMFMLRPSAESVQVLTETAVNAGLTGIVDVVRAFRNFQKSQ